MTQNSIAQTLNEAQWEDRNIAQYFEAPGFTMTPDVLELEFIEVAERVPVDNSAIDGLYALLTKALGVDEGERVFADVAGAVYDARFSAFRAGWEFRGALEGK